MSVPVSLRFHRVTGTAWPIEQARGDGIANDLFLLRVPADCAAPVGGDDVQMADARTAMADFDVGDRPLSCAYAGEEIRVMIVARVEVNVFAAQGTRRELRRIRFEKIVARNPHRAFRALKFDHRPRVRI